MLPACPDAEEVDEWVLRGLGSIVQGGWGGARWHLAPDAGREANGPRAASTVAKALGGYGNRGADVPVRAGARGLRVVSGRENNPTWGVSPDTLFPPSEAGWAEFLERAKESGLGRFGPGRAGPGGELVVAEADAAGGGGEGGG